MAAYKTIVARVEAILAKDNPTNAEVREARSLLNSYKGTNEDELERIMWLAEGLFLLEVY